MWNKAIIAGIPHRDGRSLQRVSPERAALGCDGSSGDAAGCFEDFRNHTRWSDYETAIEDMMEETATKHAPWHLIPANNKPYGRIVAFRILADRLGKDMSLDPRPIDPDLLKEAKRVLNLSASDIERASHPAKRKVKLKRNHPKI
jgi:AMP-polyphosphate phosphotransferase